MAHRTLEVTLISAEGLDDVNLFSKMHVYAVASIAGDRRSRQRTASDKNGGSNPTWNATLRFVVPEAADGLFLHVLLRSKRVLGDRDVGVVRIRLLNERSGHFLSYWVRKPSSGKHKGVLNAFYKFVDAPAAPPIAPDSFPANETESGPPSTASQAAPGYLPYPPLPATESMHRNLAGTSTPRQPPEKDAKGPQAGEPVTAYPASTPSYPAPWAYPPPRGPMRYGHPPPPAVAQKPKKGKGEMGLGLGLLSGVVGGLLIGDMIAGF